MDYSILIAELTNDPLSRGYSAMTAAQVVASLRTANRTQLVPDSNYTAKGLFGLIPDPADAETFMVGLEAAAESNPVVERALKWLEPAQGGIDVGHPTTRAMLDSLVTAGAITSQSAALVKAAGERLVSRAVELGIPEVLDGHVVSARELMGV